MTERMGESLAVSPMRQRWTDIGGTIDVGDRVLHAVRPPVYDSPTTRGLFDPTTGVYWSSDTFATPMTTPIQDVADIDEHFWHDGMAMFHNYVSPWLALVDDARFQASVNRVAELRPTGIAGCHTPAITGKWVDTAIETVRQAPSAPFPPPPDQHVLEQIQSLLHSAGAL